MTSTSTSPNHVTPDDFVAPSRAVAIAAGRVLHDLAGLRAASGDEIAEVEAMAMLNASAAFLRPRLGEEGIERIVELIRAGGARVQQRDAAMSDVGKARAAQAAERGANR